MKFAITALMTLTATAAAAHSGHIAPEGGHSHGEVLALLALAGIAVAALIRMARQR